mmetsp:Transcript_18965/g.28512  ORF Transcript_18965/g.28512 Transcript_18965/m.28512 type:complete len:181 (-) Transcript_18965:90-632(-)|eukprot:CAMPEP_0194780114 /NCGR_PEP_ID=MMETSP0323_2-20130528/72790_1 /TAXON_ID=2866 ORGANISM="Crypthecodinium cohnii, Strain Seligo" /NCGR_SAMPLE_ID=MMETSP0323_2 /ASSEMBLY_ACC=CAM_ASM_000346 /LENGTH=180 /DNA_ID=CAMNT_0039717997 /DNA_START=35 /DNA_END=577 /DNA_ORIENTATION=-
MAPTLADRPDLDDKAAGNLYSKTDLIKVLAEYYNDVLPQCGYEEDHLWTNIRILLCLICCSFGLYAQFGTKFPDDKQILGLCVLAYFFMSAVLAAVDFFVMALSVMSVKIKGETVFLDLDLPNFDSKMTLTLRSKTRSETVTSDVAGYFDSNGLLCQEAVFKDLVELLQLWEGKETKKSK